MWIVGSGQAQSSRQRLFWLIAGVAGGLAAGIVYAIRADLEGWSLAVIRATASPPLPAVCSPAR